MKAVIQSICFVIMVTSFALFDYQSARAEDGPSVDISAFIKNNSAFVKSNQDKIKQLRDNINKLGVEKGHDPKVGGLLQQATGEIDNAEAQLKQLDPVIKQLDPVKKLPRDITNSISIAENALSSVGKIQVSGPKNFPERCLLLVLDDKGREKAKKDGLTEKSGIVETFGGPNTWVLTSPNPSAPEGVDRFQLDEKVGMIGSSDPSSALLVRGHTPQNMSVTGWVDMSSKKVMCVSKANPVQGGSAAPTASTSPAAP